MDRCCRLLRHLRTHPPAFDSTGADLDAATPAGPAPPAGQMLEQEIRTHVTRPEVAPVSAAARPCSQAHGGGYFMEEDEETIPRSILEILRNLIRSAPSLPLSPITNKILTLNY